MSYFTINFDNFQIIVNGKYFNEKKKELGLNGREAPRGIKNNNEKYYLFTVDARHSSCHKVFKFAIMANLLAKRQS